MLRAPLRLVLVLLILHTGMQKALSFGQQAPRRSSQRYFSGEHSFGGG